MPICGCPGISFTFSDNSMNIFPCGTPPSAAVSKRGY
jgi:hypothetical protein